MPRAPYTRSGRVAMTAPTAIAVMIPSPMPISTWTPIIEPPTAPTDDRVVAADRVLER